MVEAFGVERASAFAAQAGVSQGLLRAMQRLTSFKSFKTAAAPGGGSSAAAAAAGTPGSGCGRRGRSLSTASAGSSSSNSRCGGSLQGGLTALEVVGGMLSGEDREFLSEWSDSSKSG
jgi:hypothetical protein